MLAIENLNFTTNHCTDSTQSSNKGVNACIKTDCIRDNSQRLGSSPDSRVIDFLPNRSSSEIIDLSCGRNPSTARVNNWLRPKTSSACDLEGSHLDSVANEMLLRPTSWSSCDVKELARGDSRPSNHPGIWKRTRIRRNGSQ